MKSTFYQAMTQDEREHAVGALGYYGRKLQSAAALAFISETELLIALNGPANCEYCREIYRKLKDRA